MKLYDTLTNLFASLKDHDREIRFIDGETDESSLGFSELWDRALALLGSMQARGMKAGDELIIFSKSNRSFVIAFWAAVLGGIVPVPVAVGISRIMLPPKTSSAVLSRMKATRNVLAEGERNTGQAEAERIRSEGNTWADKIRAFAVQRAEEIRAIGEREAFKYYAEMGQEEG